MNIDREIATKLADKVRLVMNKEIVVANENGFMLLGEKHGDFSAPCYLSICNKNKNIDSETGFVWLPISYEDKVLGAFGVRDLELSEEGLNLIQGMSEVLVYQDFLVQNLFSVSNIRTNFIKQLLLTDNIKSMEEAMAQADVLKINLRGNQAVIIVHIDGFTRKFFNSVANLNEEEQKLEFIDFAQKIELLIKKAFLDLDQNAAIYFNDDKFIILKGIQKRTPKEDTSVFLKKRAQYVYETLRKNFPVQKITLGIGQYYPDIAGLRKSFQDAVLALDIGVKIWGKGRIFHILDVGTFASLSGEISHQRKSEIAEQVLKPLLEDEDLLKTAKVFLSSGMNLTIASKELHVHRNTLIYRLSKIKKMIGLDPKKFHDALQIKLGFMMRSMGN